ncbi:MAG: hypothetical protein H7338_09360 [Candidatus Sericytochromatia bacterium]|nr:hypothetical protein [Candidatus Sericytochromatia bacterium]
MGWLVIGLIACLSLFGARPAQANTVADGSAAHTASGRVAPIASITDETVPFPANVPNPLPVGVALRLNGVSRIAEKSGTFDGDFDLQLRWRDPGLAFDAKANGTDRQEYGGDEAADKLATIWTPAVVVDNLSDKTIQGEPGLFIFSDGSVVYTQRYKTTFDASFKLGAFPFDTQALPVHLLSSLYSVNQISFVQEQRDVNASGIKDGIKSSGWKVKRLDFLGSRLRAWNGEFVPEIEARIILSRVPFAHVLGIFTPFVLILLVPTVFTLYTKEGIGPRLTAWSGSIFALIALNFTLSSRYPNLDSESLVSQVLSTGYAYQLIMVTLNVTLFNPAIAERLANRFVIQEIQAFLRWGMPVGLFAFLLTRTMLTALSW